MATSETYVLNKFSFKRVTKKHPTCPKCGLKFQMKDRVVSKNSNGKVMPYHKKCYESLWI